MNILSDPSLLLLFTFLAAYFVTLLPCLPYPSFPLWLTPISSTFRAAVAWLSFSLFPYSIMR